MPVGKVAAELSLLDLEAAGHGSAGQHDRARWHLRRKCRAPHTIWRGVAIATSTNGQLEIVGVGMLPAIEPLCRPTKPLEVRLGAGTPRLTIAVEPAIELVNTIAAGELLQRQSSSDVLGEPGRWPFSLKLLPPERGGRSPRTRAGRAATWRSMAIRSMPSRRRSPDHSSGRGRPFRGKSGSTQPVRPSRSSRVLARRAAAPPQMKQVMSN